jgi:transcriptional regulator with XRE-family HTH domain
MPEDADVWQALLRAKGLTVAQLAEDLRTTRQHAHRLLTGKRSADARRDELERALALGPRRTEGRPLYALAMLAADGELELLPAGDTQPLFADRELAAGVADSLADRSDGLCVVPVWPEYAWRRTVAFHAAWGSTAEPRNVFRVGDDEFDVPVEAVVDELRGGYAVTLRLREIADDPERLEKIETLVEPQTTTDRIRAWIDDEIHDSTAS